MGIFRVAKVRDYTTVSNYYLRDKTLSLKAKGLFTLILSLPEDWRFTIRGLSAICKEGVESIGTTLNELEKSGYLVRRRVRGADGRMGDIEYCFYEETVQRMNGQASAPDEEQEPDRDIPDTEKPDMGKPDTGNPDLENPYTVFPVQSNTHKSKTDIPITHESNPYPSSFKADGADGYDGMDKCVDIRTWNRMRAEAEAQINYEAYAGMRDSELISEIVALMAEVYCMQGGTMRISGVPYSVEVVKKRFRELTSSHIDTLLWSLKRTHTEVRNTRSYLLTSLFQAPTTYANTFEADARFRGLA